MYRIASIETVCESYSYTLGLYIDRYIILRHWDMNHAVSVGFFGCFGIHLHPFYGGIYHTRSLNMESSRLNQIWRFQKGKIMEPSWENHLKSMKSKIGVSLEKTSSPNDRKNGRIFNTRWCPIVS